MSARKYFYQLFPGLFLLSFLAFSITFNIPQAFAASECGHWYDDAAGFSSTLNDHCERAANCRQSTLKCRVLQSLCDNDFKMYNALMCEYYNCRLAQGDLDPDDVGYLLEHCEAPAQQPTFIAAKAD